MLFFTLKCSEGTYMKKKKTLTMHSRIGDVIKNPVGHDIIYKILMQVNLPKMTISNPVVSNMTLSMLVKPTEKFLNKDFWPTFLHLLNQEQDEMEKGKGPVKHEWWKEATFYQIYPKAFCDGNGDGIGDLEGIISKVDYLKKLGIDAIWLSPIYDSPMDDNGYDIRDYHKIAEIYGDMDQFDTLLNKIHDHGMKLIMDLVVNHTSDEHPYFQSAISDPDSPYRDYYFIRENDGSGERPNNWNSFFTKYAWDTYGEKNDWALHLFSKKQMDLNWENPAVRKSVKDMINFWLEKGVDGFRLDVINYISKDEGLPNGNASVGKLMGYTGIEHYFYGPKLHSYLAELNRDCFSKYHAFSVGEMPGIGSKMGQLMTSDQRHELDMMFSFDHLETPGHVRFEDYEYDLNAYRDYICNWFDENGSDVWLSLFFNNHDNPRMVSKVDPSGLYRHAICRLLATMQFTLPGTPFVYQGDEMGLMNVGFHDIHELNDVESLQYYENHVEAGENPNEVWKTVLAGTRDHARVMLPWDNESRYHQVIDQDITNVYEQLTALRKNNPTLIYGNFKVISKKKNRFIYERSDENGTFVIDCNLSKVPTYSHSFNYEWTLVFPKRMQEAYLGPYDVQVWKKLDRSKK